MSKGPFAGTPDAIAHSFYRLGRWTYSTENRQVLHDDGRIENLSVAEHLFIKTALGLVLIDEGNPERGVKSTIAVFDKDTSDGIADNLRSKLGTLFSITAIDEGAYEIKRVTLSAEFAKAVADFHAGSLPTSPTPKDFQAQYKLGNYIFSEGRRIMTHLNGTEVKLTHEEHEMLSLLIAIQQNPNNTEALHEFDNFIAEHKGNLKDVVLRIRKKVEPGFPLELGRLHEPLYVLTSVAPHDPQAQISEKAAPNYFEAQYKLGDYIFSQNSRVMTHVNGAKVRLSYREHQMLSLLIAVHQRPTDQIAIQELDRFITRHRGKLRQSAFRLRQKVRQNSFPLVATDLPRGRPYALTSVVPYTPQTPA